MRDNEIKIFEKGLERETIRGLTLPQMEILSMILQRYGVSHKKFTYKDGQLASAEWVEASGLRATLEKIDELAAFTPPADPWEVLRMIGERARVALRGK